MLLDESLYRLAQPRLVLESGRRRLQQALQVASGGAEERLEGVVVSTNASGTWQPRERRAPNRASFAPTCGMSASADLVQPDQIPIVESASHQSFDPIR